MTNTRPLATSEGSNASNVVPFRPVRNNVQGLSARPLPSWNAPGRSAGANALEQESLEQRLARRVERVLQALLYHALLEPNDSPHSTYSIEERVRQMVSRDRLMAIARAAISLGLTADLTRLAAAVIVFELKTQSRWPNKMLRPFSAHHRQINNDTLAIARLLAWDLDALKVRPIDKFAQFL